MRVFLAQPRELPWAIARTERRDGRYQYPGNVYYYFATRREAEENRRWHVTRGKYIGEIEHRPGECRQL